MLSKLLTNKSCLGAKSYVNRISASARCFSVVSSTAKYQTLLKVQPERPRLRQPVRCYSVASSEHVEALEDDGQSSRDKIVVKSKSGHMELKKGELARIADYSATGQFNQTNVLVTIVSKARPLSASFLPLTVDYLHKASAYGKIPSNFLRRDTGSSNYEVLVSRMIDRSIRPLFQSYLNDIQIVCNLLSFDGKDNPDVLCINTVSYALANSNLDWDGPIGCVRVGMSDDKFVANPSRKQLEKSPLNLVITATASGNIIMLEGWGDNLNQSKFENALAYGTKKATLLAQKIKKYSQKKKPPKVEDKPPSEPITKLINELQGFMIEEKDLTVKKADRVAAEIEKLDEKFQNESHGAVYDVFTNYNHDKRSRDEAISQLRNAFVNSVLKLRAEAGLKAELFNYQSLSEQFSQLARKVFRELILEESKRCDGRGLDDLRPIRCVADMYKSLHGSALFQRGQTQVLCSLTFDSPDAMYKSSAISHMMSPSLTNFNKNFMLHYEFPSYAINEIARQGGRADRREIGHGALAEKSVYPLIPEDYPFTIRCQCEVLESNGSSSMASVCATSMALMDAGVPIKEPVCGVAMGIVTEHAAERNSPLKYKILTDISGIEDYMGDMDFKVAGTVNGITAVQADFKIAGLPFEIIKEIMKKSQDARSRILSIMNSEISKPRETKKPNHPITKTIEIPVTQRSRFIGIGGVNLKQIQAKTDVQVTPVDETKFSVFAPNQTALDEAEEIIKKLVDKPREPELDFGGIYSAKIVEIVPSGLMIKLYPTMQPTLLPNSQLDGKKVFHGSVSEFKLGQEIQVKYFGRDPVDGRMRVSRKALFNSNLPAKDMFEKS